eukprot:TRINITY_DN9345_c0_g2_i3.p1 TRINITY_DN9345_c0_g2~~TRINITY_DN9345_c0_g2_i3.p1  ORF type:complete len:160 (-),score=60.27 TRINITY_DN9345_c0_g2_i3:170-649(-)
MGDLPVARDMECNVCMEGVVSRGKRFGILSGCSHAFCLECIRKWRGKYMQNVDKGLFRLCPICRKESYFVVPSSVYVEAGPEKEKLIQEYKRNLGTIPCKYLKSGGACPFGNSCFYAHVDKNGKKVYLPWIGKTIKEDGTEELDQGLRLCDKIIIPKKK